MRVTHVINGLGVGGAERALLRLVQDTSTEIAHHIIALTCVDGLRAEFEQVPNVRVRAIGARRGLVGAASVVACTRYIAASEPQVIHGWLKQSCAVACLAATAVPSLRRVPLVCGVRDTVGSAGASASERVALSVGRILSPRCDMLLSNSTAALDQLIGVGYRPRRSEVLHNGVDVPPDVELREARQRERARLGIADADSVALFVGSLHPAKDPGCLLRAVERMRAQMPRLVVLRAGRGPYEGEATPDALKLLASPLVRQLGVVSDVPSLMAAADVLLLSSLREGCPNVVLEALAAGVPVAATDVGDVRIVVGEEGVVVTPGDGRALGDAAFGLLRLGATERATLAFRARQRMRDSHLRGTVNTRIVSIYRTLLSIAKLR
jgi:glycosyltransferase involved in cell wall biosynthesis